MRQFGKIAVASVFVLVIGVAGIGSAFHVLGQGPGSKMYGEARGSLISSVILVVLLGAYVLVRSTVSTARRQQVYVNLLGMCGLIVGGWWFFVNLALYLNPA